MTEKPWIPFQNTTKEGWINLSLAVVVTVYAVSMINVVLKLTTCESVVIDFCAFWSAGRIINDHGFASVYDLNLLHEVQSKVFNIQSGVSFQPFAILYLPIFLFPFSLTSLMNFQISYVIWALVNLVGLVLYLRYFVKKALARSLPVRHLMLFGVPLAVFINFFQGQVNLLMLIGVGGFIISIRSDKPFQAGLWLGTLLIKPQFLILMVPFVVIQRKYKVIIGFLLSFLLVMIASFALIGLEGFETLANVLIVSVEGGAFSNPWAQMNWRMIGQHLTLYTSPSFGLTIAIFGALLTAAVSLIIFSMKTDLNDDLFVVAVLGLLAATGVVAWHAHLHSSIILIPPLLYLFMKNQIRRRWLLYWVFVPVLVQFIGLFVLFLGERGILHNFIHQYYLLGIGLVGFVFNMIFLVWTLIRVLKSDLQPRTINSMENIIT